MRVLFADVVNDDAMTPLRGAVLRIDGESTVVGPAKFDTRCRCGWITGHETYPRYSGRRTVDDECPMHSNSRFVGQKTRSTQPTLHRAKSFTDFWIADCKAYAVFAVSVYVKFALCAGLKHGFIKENRLCWRDNLILMRVD